MSDYPIDLTGRTDHPAQTIRAHRYLNRATYSADFDTLQGAIDDAAAKDRPLIIAPGVHLQTDTLHITNVPGLTIYAAGATLRWTATVDAALSIANSSRCHLNDLVIDGNGHVGQGVALSGGQSYFRGSTLRISGCDLGVSFTGGVWCCSIRESEVLMCRIGIYMHDSAGQNNANMIDTCSLAANSEYGIWSSGGTSNRVTYCTFESNRLGAIYQERGLVPTFIHNHFEVNGCEEARTAQMTIGDGLYSIQNPTIQGNYFFGGYSPTVGQPGYCDYAIRLNRAANAIIQGNYAWGHVEASALYEGAVTKLEQANSWQV